MTTKSCLFNPLAGQTSYQLVRNAYHEHNLDQVINQSTHTLILVQQRKLISLLDLRAKAFAMKGQFTKAVADAEEIIRYTPTWAIGYLRLGQILLLQGKQSAAIQVYDEALIKLHQDDPSYPDLDEAKKKAIEKNERVLDFIMLLPFEIVDSIFEYLPEVNRLTCMEVSTGWRDRLSNSPLAWSTIYNNYFYYDVRGAAAVLRVIPYVAKHVKHMTVNTDNEAIGRSYLEYFENGAFKKLKSLELTAASIFHLTSTNMVMSFTNALWQIRNTVTKLDLTYDFDDINTSITDILFYSPHLKTLVLYILDSLEWSMGNALGEPHLALEDVEIESTLASGRALRPLLQHCPNIRRLCLKNSEPSVIDVVDEMCNEKLQIFSYNPKTQGTSLEAMDKKYYDGPPGLREIVISNGGPGGPSESVIQLLHKNQKSLETIHVNLSEGDDQNSYPNFRSPYEQWYFKRIQQFTYSPDIHRRTERLFLQSISSCNLQLFSIVDSPNLPMIVNTLMDLPPLEKLILLKMDYSDNLNNQRSAALIRLFQHYASFPSKSQRLREVGLEHCGFISDQVLDILARLPSLRIIEFADNITIRSSDTLCGFLDKVKDRVVEVRLKRMDEFDDAVLDTLGNMKNLERLILEDMYQMSDDGIINMVDNTTSLHTLVLKECLELDLETMSYAKSKIKHFEIVDMYN